MDWKLQTEKVNREITNIKSFSGMQYALQLKLTYLLDSNMQVITQSDSSYLNISLFLEIGLVAELVVVSHCYKRIK